MIQRGKILGLIILVIVALISLYLYQLTIAKKTASPIFFESVISQLDKCIKDRKNTNCYESVAKKLVGNLTYPQILDFLKNNSENKAIFSSCHLLLHYVGHELYKKEKNLPMALSECSNYCVGGCFHGVAEEYFREKYANVGNLNEKEFQKDISGACKDRLNCQNMMTNNVTHGLGHALLFLTDYNLQKTLLMCDKYTHNQYSGACFGGAFMENWQSIRFSDHQSRNVKTDDLLYPCDTLEKKYLKSCYQNQSENLFTDNVSKNIEL